MGGYKHNENQAQDDYEKDKIQSPFTKQDSKHKRKNKNFIPAEKVHLCAPEGRRSLALAFLTS